MSLNLKIFGALKFFLTVAGVQMMCCTQLSCKWLTLAAFCCQSVTYVCIQCRLLDTGSANHRARDASAASALLISAVPDSKQ